MEMKNVLNIMLLAPWRHRIIGPRGDAKNNVKTQQQQSGIWRTDLHVQNIGTFCISTWPTGFVFEQSSEVS